MNITFEMDGVILGNEWDKLKNETLGELKEIYARIEEEFGLTDKTYSLTTINFNSQNAQDTLVDEINKTITIRLRL